MSSGEEVRIILKVGECCGCEKLKFFKAWFF